MRGFYRTAVLVIIAVGAPLLLVAIVRTEPREPLQMAGYREDVTMEEATFAAGCFWGVEEAFRHMEGVVDTEVGYTGGDFENPTYEDVCSGKTGHVEAVRVLFNPSKVSYEELLTVFWDCHNPTTPNRQGPDVGTQYRSAIFCHTPEQKEAAEESKRRLDQSGRYAAPIITRIVPASEFWRAEEYHQHYLEKSGIPTCHL